MKDLVAGIKYDAAKAIEQAVGGLLAEADEHLARRALGIAAFYVIVAIPPVTGKVGSWWLKIDN